MSEDGWDRGPLDPVEVAVVYAAVMLGLVVSLVVLTGLLALVGYRVVAPVAGVGALALPLVGGRLVRERGVCDWRATRSKPLAVRLFRLAMIGASWGVWLGRS